ncbi:MAG: hypothetical protein LBL30_00015 [Holosporales bacterium]|jgi:hypothetical protein|nr:hypothetical protein [Holosporales bacterium]
MLNKDVLSVWLVAFALSGAVTANAYGSYENTEQIAGTNITDSNYSSIRQEIEKIERAAKLKIDDNKSAYAHKLTHNKKHGFLHRIRNLMHKLRTSNDPEGTELLKRLEILEYKISSLHAHLRCNNFLVRVRMRGRQQKR